MKPIFITVGLLVLISECFLRICFIQIGLSYFQRQLEGKPEIVPLIVKNLHFCPTLMYIHYKFSIKKWSWCNGDKNYFLFHWRVILEPPCFQVVCSSTWYTWTISCINNMHDILKSTLIKRFIYPWANTHIQVVCFDYLWKYRFDRIVYYVYTCVVSEYEVMFCIGISAD